MPRRRKLVAPGRPTETAQAPEALAHQAPVETTPQGPRRRRKLVKRGENPAVSQFAGYPEAQAKVREALKTNPKLEPTAFSWSPLRMGGPLCAAEAERVMAGKSIRVPGLLLTGTGEAVCRDCYPEAKERGLLEGKGWDVTLYKPPFRIPAQKRTCFICEEEFYGEQGR